MIDKDGFIRYTHFGEGGYAETESLIRELLAEANPSFLKTSLLRPEAQTLDHAFLTSQDGEVTRELYAGFECGATDILFGQGGYVQQLGYLQSRNQIGEFIIEKELEPHKINFQGSWFVGPESTTHGRTTANYEDYLSLVYSATSVNVVLNGKSGEPYKVLVTAGDKYLTDENTGSDIVIGEDGESYLLVTTPTLYNVINNDSYVRRGTLNMSSNSPDFELFAFTFGIYDTGP